MLPALIAYVVLQAPAEKPLICPPLCGLFYSQGKILKRLLEMLPENDWHLSRTVNLSHIVATILLVAGGFSAYFGISERLAVLESQFVQLSERVVRVLEAQQRVDDAQDRDLVSFRNEIRGDVRELNAKIDRLLEMAMNRANER